MTALEGAQAWTIDQPDDWTEPGAHPVADGVYRIPLPLPGDALRAVNVYAIADPDGLVVVDGGWTLEESERQLEDALAVIGAGLADIRRFLVTHAHRDHYTQAVAIRRRFGARVALGAGERPTLDWVADPNRKPLESQIAHLVRVGATDLAERLRGLAPEPDVARDWVYPDEWLDGETSIALGTRTLSAVPTPGHTSGHFVFVDGAAEVMFAGDHVLPRITPSIGLEPTPAAYPLKAFLDSLRLVRSRPDARLLPAHGPAAPSVHARVDQLIEHHDDRLSATRSVIAAGASTAYEAAKALRWTRRERTFAELDLYNQTLAVGETVAHLDLLALTGRLTRVDGDVIHYATP